MLLSRTTKQWSKRTVKSASSTPTLKSPLMHCCVSAVSFSTGTKLAASDPDGGIRRLACQSLYYVATAADIPTIEMIAAGDALKRTRMQRGQSVECYPIREAAAELIGYIKSKEN